MDINNTQTKSNIRFLLGFFLVLFFAFSAINVFWLSRSLDRWIFVFYSTEVNAFEYETRYLEPVRGREESLKLMVREILLGSFNPLYSTLWARDTPLLSLFLDGTKLYVNVGGSILQEGERGLQYLSEIIALNIRQNFSFTIDEIVLAVEGETWRPTH